MVSFSFLYRKLTQSIIFPQKMLMPFWFLLFVCLGLFFEGKKLTNYFWLSKPPAPQEPRLHVKHFCHMYTFLLAPKPRWLWLCWLLKFTKLFHFQWVRIRLIRNISLYILRFLIELQQQPFHHLYIKLHFSEPQGETKKNTNNNHVLYN